MATQIKLRRDTGANWTTNSTVVLAAGEIGVNLTSGQFKLGDGASTWAELIYFIPLDLSAVDQDIIPDADNTRNIGSPSRRWQHGYFASGSLYVGDLKISNNAGILKVQQVTDAGLETEAEVPGAPGVVTTDRIVNGANTFAITTAGELELNGDPFTGGGGGGGLSITDFGRGFVNTLDDGKITTNKLYNRPANQALNNHFELSVTNGGVVTLPDGSIINGATLKTVPGNYAGITAGPASPAGRDEDSWVWVDNDGATIATKYSTDNYQWKFDNTGNLILPNGMSIDSYGTSGVNAFLDIGGDDTRITIDNNGAPPGLTITTNATAGMGQRQWSFGPDGDLTLPEGGDILDSNGDSVLGGGSYTPDDSDNWNDPTINTISAALDELAARVTALQNYEIDGGNANTPELGELLIDGNGA